MCDYLDGLAGTPELRLVAALAVAAAAQVDRGGTAGAFRELRELLRRFRSGATKLGFDFDKPDIPNQKG